MSFVLGANLPWVRYGGDFGANAWSPEGGLSTRPADQQRVLDVLLRLRAGRRHAAALVLPVRRPRRHPLSREDGAPLEMQMQAWRDIDVALDLVRKADLSLMPVLFDFHLCRPRRVVNGVQTGGRSRLISRRRSARAPAGQHRRAAAGQLRPRAGDRRLGPVQRARVGHLRRRDLESRCRASRRRRCASFSHAAAARVHAADAAAGDGGHGQRADAEPGPRPRARLLPAALVRPLRVARAAGAPHDHARLRCADRAGRVSDVQLGADAGRAAHDGGAKRLRRRVLLVGAGRRRLHASRTGDRRSWRGAIPQPLTRNESRQRRWLLATNTQTCLDSRRNSA